MDARAGGPAVEIRLDRADRSYRPGESVTGEVVLRTQQAHQGIRLVAEGATKLHLNARNVGLFEAFYSSVEPSVFFRKTVQATPAGSPARGGMRFRFEVPLEPSPETPKRGLLDTYHGVYINTGYVINVEVARGLLSSSLVSEMEFIVEVPAQDEDGDEGGAGARAGSGAQDGVSAVNVMEGPVAFSLSPETLEHVDPSVRKALPPFRVRGAFHSLDCRLRMPLTGELVVDAADQPIKSVELQLVRVETVRYAEGLAQEATEIQSLEVAAGDLCRGLVVPLHMVFPRHFTCPTLSTENFAVEFELNLLLLLSDGTLVTEGFPVRLRR